MKQITITINLDPVTDGIHGEIEESVSTSGRFLVIGTNYEHRVISEEEFYQYISQMEDHEEQLVLGDYLIIYDDRNVLSIVGEKYLVGSFLLAKMSSQGDVFERISDAEIETVKEYISSHFAEIMINGNRYSALSLE